MLAGHITGPLRAFPDAQFADATGGAGCIEIDDADPDGQSLLFWYPEVEPRDGTYVQPAIHIQAGAKSALDPHRPVAIRPYIAEDVLSLDLATAEVTTIDATRNRHLGERLPRPLDAISRADVEARFNSITADHGLSAANRAMSLLRSIYRRPCVDHDGLRNPVDLWLAGGGKFHRKARRKISAPAEVLPC